MSHEEADAFSDLAGDADRQQTFVHFRNKIVSLMHNRRVKESDNRPSVLQCVQDKSVPVRILCALFKQLQIWLQRPEEELPLEKCRQVVLSGNRKPGKCNRVANRGRFPGFFPQKKYDCTVSK